MNIKSLTHDQAIRIVKKLLDEKMGDPDDDNPAVILEEITLTSNLVRFSFRIPKNSLGQETTPFMLAMLQL